MEVRPPRDEERPELARRLAESWGGPAVVTRGRIVDASRLPAFVCVLDGDLAGLAAYEVTGDECELVSLDAVHAGAIAESRRLKPSISEVGMHGIPIRDEVELASTS
jgi:hypothetical protein